MDLSLYFYLRYTRLLDLQNLEGIRYPLGNRDHDRRKSDLEIPWQILHWRIIWCHISNHVDRCYNLFVFRVKVHSIGEFQKKMYGIQNSFVRLNLSMHRCIVNLLFTFLKANFYHWINAWYGGSPILVWNRQIWGDVLLQTVGTLLYGYCKTPLIPLIWCKRRRY
jgi:hypothetical protein